MIRVTIELERMQYAIESAMHAHFATMDAECNAAIEEAIKAFDYTAEVRMIVDNVLRLALRKAIEDQFKYDGAGFKAMESIAKKLVGDAMAGAAKRSEA